VRHQAGTSRNSLLNEAVILLDDVVQVFEEANSKIIVLALVETVSL
jgi:hypothetical protein